MVNLPISQLREEEAFLYPSRLRSRGTELNADLYVSSLCLGFFFWGARYVGEEGMNMGERQIVLRIQIINEKNTYGNHSIFQWHTHASVWRDA